LLPAGLGGGHTLIRRRRMQRTRTGHQKDRYP